MAKGIKREATYKQMGFETAIRNPERYKGILAGVKEFEGRILNSSCVLEIVTHLYRSNAVSATGVQDASVLDDEQLKEEIIKANSTRNSDGGFPKGYCARFWTYMRTLSEFGFVYARYNEKFKISKVAKMLINNEIDEQEAFSMQSMIYNRRSPYRNVSNDYNYFKFIVAVLKCLATSNKSLSYEQFIVSLFSKDGNVKDFLKTIEGNDFSDGAKVYDFLCSNYQITTRENTVLKDYPDVVLRLLRITGFVTIMYKGKTYIQLNSDKEGYIDRLISIPFTLSMEAKEDSSKFFIEANSIFDKLLCVVVESREGYQFTGKDYCKKLDEIVSMYQIDEEKATGLVASCGGLESGKGFNLPEFKYIPEPLKLEFFISILLFVKYGKKYFIKPNYKIDSLGMPISHAPGNAGDIEVTSDELFWLVEVTLIRSKAQQMNFETTTTIRHLLSNEEFKTVKDRYLSFVAPIVHADTEDYYKYSIVKARQDSKNVFIKPYNLQDFLLVTVATKNLNDMVEYSDEVIKDYKKALN